MREYLVDLERVRLNILGEAGPGKSQIVPHEIVNWVARDQSCAQNSVPTCVREKNGYLTEGIWQPEDSVTGKE